MYTSIYIISYTISYTHIVCDLVCNFVYDVVYDIECRAREIYSWALAAAAKRRRFKVSVPFRLDSATRASSISLASFTETFLGNALP